MSFAEMLQKVRRTRGFTQEQLAEELGVSRQSISKWEKGDTYPETERLILLTGKLNTSLDDLLKEEIIAAGGKYQEIGRKNRDEGDTISDLFAERFPKRAARKRIPEGKRFRWSDENIRRAMEYLEGTSYCISCIDSSGERYKKHRIFHDGKLFNKNCYKNGHTDNIEVLGRDETISTLDRYRFTRRLRDVEFEYYGQEAPETCG